jgi:hypothetical protein
MKFYIFSEVGGGKSTQVLEIRMTLGELGANCTKVGGVDALFIVKEKKNIKYALFLLLLRCLHNEMRSADKN